MLFKIFRKKNCATFEFLLTPSPGELQHFVQHWGRRPPSLGETYVSRTLKKYFYNREKISASHATRLEWYSSIR